MTMTQKKPPRQRGVPLLLFCVLVILLLAENVSVAAKEDRTPAVPQIEGTISTSDGHQVRGVSVIAVEQQIGLKRRVRTNSNGRFRFSNLHPGSYRIHVELEGFKRASQPVLVKPEKTASLEFLLVPVPFTETITVTVTKSEEEVGDVPVHISILNRKDIERSAALTVDDLLKQTPSFSLFRRTSSLVSHPTTQGVSLRGIGASGASRTLVLVDGIPENDSFGNWVYWSKIPQSQIEMIEIAEGGLSNLYGSSAMAGVINVHTRKPEPGTISVKAQGGMRDTGDLDLFASHEVGPFAASIGGSIFRTDGYILISPEQRGPVDIDAASQHEMGNWKLEYSPSSNLTFFHTGRFFNEDRDNGTPLQTNSSRETFLAGGLRAVTSDGSDWRANIFTHRSTFDSSFSAVSADRTSESLSLLQDTPYEDVGANAQWFRRVAQEHLIAAGFDTRWIEADIQEDVFVEGINVRDRAITGKQLSSGFFLQDYMSPFEKLVLVAGIRFDYWENYDASRVDIVNSTGSITPTILQDTTETTLTPRAGLMYRLSNTFSLRGSFYQGFRAPSLNELYRPFRVGNVLTNANENLKPERLTGGEVGFHHSPSRNLFWQVTGFWNRLKDPISNITLSVSPTLIIRQRQNLGRADIWGIEAEMKYRFDARFYLHAQYLFDEATVEDFAPDPTIEGNRIPQVPKHRASVRFDYSIPAQLDISLLGRFESLRFDDDRNQIKLGSFFVADLIVSRPLGELSEVFLSVENLFNRQYAVQATPVEQLGTPIIVTGGLRFHFAR